mmetsp:Transcript_101022/g.261595  ORF Transcript_101022/g.261595 Transcript_101022/m.261595 type:complete len:289 (-) Transcript_101022:43-909(-)
MGLPAQAARMATGQQPGMSRESMDAPLRLQTESYEAFTRRFQHLVQDSATEGHSSVEEELRKLDIDPAVFYRDARRVEMQRFAPDDLDPTHCTAAAGCDVPGAPRAVAAALDGGDDGDDDQAESWLPGGSKLFAPPARKGLPAAEAFDGEEEPSPPPGADRGLRSLNVPSSDEVEDLPYEELVDTSAGETRGGRLGHETPRGLEGMLQVDSLTDDGDEDDPFREDLLKADDAALAAAAAGDVEEEAVEAFSLDPDFDYDNVENLTAKDGPPGAADVPAAALLGGPAED